MSNESQKSNYWSIYAICIVSSCRPLPSIAVKSSFEARSFAKFMQQMPISWKARKLRRKGVKMENELHHKWHNRYLWHCVQLSFSFCVYTLTSMSGFFPLKNGIENPLNKQRQQQQKKLIGIGFVCVSTQTILNLLFINMSVLTVFLMFSHTLQAIFT